MFISTAIDDMVKEYQDPRIEWLEIMTDGPVVAADGDYQAVNVTPTVDGPFGDGETRLTYRLYSKLLRDELNADLTSDVEPDYDAVDRRFWRIVEECLTSERSYIALTKARTIHAMRLAAYAYDPREGMHYLPNLVDAEFDLQYQQYLADRGW